jgi:hypothetical protein
MPGALYVLFGAAFTVAACVAAGRLLVDRLRLPLNSHERWLFGFLLGGVLVSNLTFLLSTVHLARKGVFLAAGVGLIWWSARRRLPCPAACPAANAARDRFWDYLFFGVGGVYALIYLLNAMAPEISPDGAAYHLGMVARYLREHGFHRLTTNMYANLSEGVEMLFLFAFAFGRHSGAAMVHFAYLVALPLAMFLYGRRFGLAPAAACAALFVFASPMVGIDGVSAYIDVAVAAITFGLFYLLEIWDADRSPGLLIAIGLLAGFAYAVKYTAGVAVPYAIGFVAWRSIRGGKPVAKPVLIVGLCAAAMMLPWMAKNWIWLRNPVSPFLNSVFPNPYIQVGFEKEYAEYMRHYEDVVHGYHEMPWALAVDGRMAGILGPLFLLAPVALLAVRRREGRRLLAAAAVFGCTWFLNVGARFLIPALPFLAFAMALVFIRWKPLAAALVVAHALISLPGMTWLYCRPAAWRIRRIPVSAALRIEQEDSYLDENLPTYRMARLIERTVPPGATVFAITELAEAYTTRNILSKDLSASNQVLGDILWTPLQEGSLPQRRFEFRFPPAAVRRIRLIQTASAPAQWSIAELRVFQGDREIAPAPSWRLNARPNPWDIQLALDGRPVTRWRAWMPIEAGDFVQVDFGREETIDRVVIECSRDQYRQQLRLEGGAGTWRTLAGSAEISDGPPLEQLPRLATAEMKRRGVDYLAVYHDDFGAPELRSHPEAWGLLTVGILGDDRLYRIESVP